MDLQALVHLAVAQTVDHDVAIDTPCENVDPIDDGEGEEVKCVLVADAVTGGHVRWVGAGR